MSDMISKDRLTAYQRWELPTFDIVPEEIDAVPAATLPTAAEVEHIHQQAHEEGYQAGYAEGAQRARDEEQKAREEEQKAREEKHVALDEVQRLSGIIEAMDKALQQVDELVAQNLLDLSMEMAKQMLQQALKVKPELILSVVNEAIGQLPHFSQHARLILHPSDAELVRNKMGEQLDHTGWKIFEDAQLEPGGCRVETAHSQVDASLSTRWKRVVSSIGQDNSWMEP
jgi:flagellar assembly protein FliH